MLSLDSPRWSELEHAYGSASDIPSLLAQLEAFPSAEGNSEPWFSLWSALCHQGDVYPASFAAVPHIVRILGSDPVRADASFFSLPACIEIARVQNRVEIPFDLQFAYSEAFQRLPLLAGAAAARAWDEDLLCSILAAIAAAKGFTAVAEAALELNTSTAEEFLGWFREQ